jgi:hypothetical protein
MEGIIKGLGLGIFGTCMEDNAEFFGSNDGEMGEEKLVLIASSGFEKVLLPLINEVGIVLLEEVGGIG